MLVRAAKDKTDLPVASGRRFGIGRPPSSRASVSALPFGRGIGRRLQFDQVRPLRGEVLFQVRKDVGQRPPLTSLLPRQLVRVPDAVETSSRALDRLRGEEIAPAGASEQTTGDGSPVKRTYRDMGNRSSNRRSTKSRRTATTQSHDR